MFKCFKVFKEHTSTNQDGYDKNGLHVLACCDSQLLRISQSICQTVLFTWRSSLICPFCCPFNLIYANQLQITCHNCRLCAGILDRIASIITLATFFLIAITITTTQCVTQFSYQFFCNQHCCFWYFKFLSVFLSVAYSLCRDTDNLHPSVRNFGLVEGSALLCRWLWAATIKYLRLRTLRTGDS